MRRVENFNPDPNTMPNQSYEKLQIRPATPADGASLARIYNYYVTTTVVTFEEDPIAPSEMARRVEDVGSASLPWLLAEQAGNVLGYAYASKWKGRCAYRFSVETTVYLDPLHMRRGLGSLLYNSLLPILMVGGIHAAIGGIALPNEGSVALHEKFGFQKVAHFKEVGFKFGRWIDVGYWQRIL
jgi:phosphinothricin acetyltransferase